MINQGWLLSFSETGRNNFTGYTVTILGREKLEKKMIDTRPDEHKSL